MPMLPLFLISLGAVAVLTMIAFALSGPSPQRAGARRLGALRERHSTSPIGAVDAQLRRITGKSATKADIAAMRFLPKPAELKKRLAMTGKTWTVGQYGTVTLGITTTVCAGLVLAFGLPVLLALFLGLALVERTPRTAPASVRRHRQVAAPSIAS